MPKYLLPCACGNQIPVEPKDAGLTVQCSCGAQVKVPNTRSIFALPRYTTDSFESAGPATSGWGLRNQVFSAGLTCLLFGGMAMSYFLYTREPHPSEAMAASKVRNMNYAQIFSMWEKLHEGFAPFETQYVADYDLRLGSNKRKTWISGAVAAGGLAMIVAGFVAPKRRAS